LVTVVLAWHRKAAKTKTLVIKRPSWAQVPFKGFTNEQDGETGDNVNWEGSTEHRTPNAERPTPRENADLTTRGTKEQREHREFFRQNEPNEQNFNREIH
jgi:hypothetical protein